MTELGPEWVPDGEGVPSRKGARIVLFNRAGQVLLIRGHDAHDPHSSWWFTVGGGLNAGECPREGAVRELREETGLEVPAAELVGPVLHRQAEFQFFSVRARQDELFYLAMLEGDPNQISTAGFTAVELQTLDELRWFAVPEVQQLAETERIYPEALPKLIDLWSRGWDGELLELSDVTYADPHADEAH